MKKEKSMFKKIVSEQEYSEMFDEFFMKYSFLKDYKISQSFFEKMGVEEFKIFRGKFSNEMRCMSKVYFDMKFEIQDFLEKNGLSSRLDLKELKTYDNILRNKELLLDNLFLNLTKNVPAYKSLMDKYFAAEDERYQQRKKEIEVKDKKYIVTKILDMDDLDFRTRLFVVDDNGETKISNFVYADSFIPNPEEVISQQIKLLKEKTKEYEEVLESLNKKKQNKAKKM